MGSPQKSTIFAADSFLHLITIRLYAEGLSLPPSSEGVFSFLYIAPPCPSFFVLHRHVIAPSWLKIEGLYLSKNLLRGVIYVAAPHHGYGARMVFF